jgi:hypothetical protein|tara:strand:+ start:2591 stop:2740 length:150 start_codon:yes stop_codon:yes gene_type:complete
MILETMANWASIIIMLAMVKVVWQLESASQLLKAMQRILVDTAEDYKNE